MSEKEPIVGDDSTEAAVVEKVLKEKDVDKPVDKKDSIEVPKKQLSKLDKISSRLSLPRWRLFFLDHVGPFIMFICAARLRIYSFYHVGKIIWDEAHFAKFGSFYLAHEYYHDVHPPLGKMLVALGEYLGGYRGTFDLENATYFPAVMNHYAVRNYMAFYGALVIPICFHTARLLKYNYWTSYLVTSMVMLDIGFIVISKFILLDPILLLFTATTFYCMCKLHTLRNQPFTKKWICWFLLTGISIGCVCSVKWVGLFITVVVGFYTIIDLLRLYYDPKVGKLQYMKHWSVRILYLIIIPFLIYMFCFKIHFNLLYKSGTGDASTNTIFQINLEGSKIGKSPRVVTYGSNVTIRSHGLSPNLLHSHFQTYPDGSQQRQVTGYGFFDSNNVWQFQLARGTKIVLNDHFCNENGNLLAIGDGTTIRLVHNETHANLHSHEVPSHVSRGNFEVSGYGDETVGDDKDNWVVEIVKQLPSPSKEFNDEEPHVLHAVSTVFRLRHAVLGCYLATTGLQYPSWGFSQAEIVCKKSWTAKDKSTWWNVEDHWNTELDIAENYVPPKSKFWSDFILLNFAMASTNNALIPDSDAHDALSSSWWEWPILYRGLRMSDWSETDSVRFYMLTSPFNTWISTLSVLLVPFISLIIIIRWKRQLVSFTEEEIWQLLMQLGFPFIAWLTHYLPFVIMSRVTYFHHYMPALYFAIFIFGSMVDRSIGSTRFYIKVPIYLILFVGTYYSFHFFRPFCNGMVGRSKSYEYLKWIPTWHITNEVE